MLPRLPIGAEELRGDTRLGQCVLFYTRSRKPEPAIKRQAERLLTKWMSLMLKRPDDWRNRDLGAVQAAYVLILSLPIPFPVYRSLDRRILTFI